MKKIYLNDWANNTDDTIKATLASEFAVSREELANLDILIADYTYVSYEGNAFILYRNNINDKLYEINGSHCSCYGLEGQWKPEETTIEALMFRHNKGLAFPSEYIEVLDSLSGKTVKDDDGLPVRVTTWFDEIDAFCKEHDENAVLLVADCDREDLHKEFPVNNPPDILINAWTARFAFTCIGIAEAGYILTGMERNPSRLTKQQLAQYYGK